MNASTACSSDRRKLAPYDVYNNTSNLKLEYRMYSIIMKRILPQWEISKY